MNGSLSIRPAPATFSGRDNMSPLPKRYIYPRLWLTGLIIWTILLLFLVYPLLSIAKNAIISDGRLSIGPMLALLEDPYIAQIAFNSLGLALSVSILTTLVAIPVALLLAYKDFPGRRLVLLLLAVPLLLPPFIGVIGLRQLLGRFGS